MSKFNTYQETGGTALAEAAEVIGVCEARGEVTPEDFIDLITKRSTIVGGPTTRFSKEVILVKEII